MKDILVDMIQRVGTLIPFVLSVNGKAKVNWMRLVEFAFLIGMVYATVYTRLESLEKQLIALRAEWKADRVELIEDIRKFRDDLYTPAGKRDHWGYRPNRTERNNP